MWRRPLFFSTNFPYNCNDFIEAIHRNFGDGEKINFAKLGEIAIRRSKVAPLIFPSLFGQQPDFLLEMKKTHTFPTPEEMIYSILDIDCRYEIAIPNITNHIHEITRIGTPLFIVFRTDPKRGRFKFACPHLKDIQCKAFIEIHLGLGRYSVTNTFFLHKHSITDLIPGHHRNQILQDDRLQIMAQTEIRVPADIIRDNLRLSASPAALYNVRKNILHERRQNQALQLSQLVD
jgi:hypothetical protein